MIRINTLKVEKLKDLLRQRELPSSGQKAELVQRLSEALKSDEIYLPTEGPTSENGERDSVKDRTEMLRAQLIR